jgi:hypothetical protein
MTPYTIEVARQRFSLWAACRAAQAGSAKARRSQFIAALLECGVVAWIADPKNHTADLQTYNGHFDTWVTNVQRCLEEQHRKPVMYGVAAKLVSTYLKSVFVLTGSERTPLAAHMTPPIDSVLLKKVDAVHKTRLSARFKWQKLTRQEYQEVVRELRRVNGSAPLWHLEQYWEL